MSEMMISIIIKRLWKFILLSIMTKIKFKEKFVRKIFVLYNTNLKKLMLFYFDLWLYQQFFKYI